MPHRAYLLALTLLLSILGLHAQSTLAGDWQGTLRLPAGSLRLVLHLHEQTSHQWTGTLDSPDQEAFGLPLDRVSVSGDSLQFSSSALGIDYRGSQIATDHLHGRFAQGPVSLPLDLKRATSSPSTKPSYTVPEELQPFGNEELAIPVPGTDVVLAGSLTLPRTGMTSYPIVLLITGSGPQDRDETILGKHKPFLYLTRALCQAGYGVFRYDDRGTGLSTGVYATSHIQDFIADATAVVQRLGADPRLQVGKLFLLGHSEGAYIVAKVASQHHDIAGVISLAGPGLPTDQVLLAQLKALAESAGVSPEQLDRLQRFNEQTYSWMKDNSLPLDSVKRLVSQRYRTTSDLPTFGMTESQLLSQLTPYLRELLTLDIAGTWRGVTSPVIALYGTKDLQVLPANAQALQKLLPKARIHLLPGLNHLFLPCLSGSPAEYTTLAPGFSPEALRVLIQELDQLR